jgi:hypothetical protein
MIILKEPVAFIIDPCQDFGFKYTLQAGPLKKFADKMSGAQKAAGRHYSGFPPLVYFVQCFFNGARRLMLLHLHTITARPNQEF